MLTKSKVFVRCGGGVLGWKSFAFAACVLDVRWWNESDPGADQLTVESSAPSCATQAQADAIALHTLHELL